MKSGDTIFRVVVLTGLGMVTAAAETVSCGGNKPPHEGPDFTDAGTSKDSASKVDGDLIGDDASDGSNESSDDASTGKDGFPMEGPQMPM